MSLKERRNIVDLYEHMRRGVLFTLVEVRGSSYRRAGARMFAAADGTSAGTISGGCLEAELLRRSDWHVRGGAQVQMFSTLFDDASEVPYGLGCGGEVSLLSEAADSAEAGALMDACAASLRGEHRIIATVLPEAGASLLRFVMDDRGDVLFASDDLETEDIVPLRRMARASSHGVLHPLAQGRMFVERMTPVQRLAIFGAGEDARPLADMAHAMGWRVAVVDTRAQRVTADRFSHAEERVVATDASLVLPEDAVVVMTHSYEQDRRLIAELLRREVAFAGLLGARHRSALLLKEAAEMAGTSLAFALEKVHAPVGLELGGEGPAAIALAITAEIQLALNRAAPSAFTRRMTLADAENSLAQGPERVAKDACSPEDTARMEMQ